MRDTDSLIADLAVQAGPVRRLRRPAQRAALWLLFAAGVIGAAMALHGMRPDLGRQFADPAFCLCLAGSLATGVLAAFAACLVVLPDRAPAWALLPLPAAALWFGTIGYGCLTDWVRIAPGAVQLGEAASCFAMLLACGLPLSAAMLWLLRRAAPLHPLPAVPLGALAAAGLTASALTVMHPVDASALILLWNAGTLVLLLSADLAAGHRLLRPAPPGAGAAPRPRQ